MKVGRELAKAKVREAPEERRTRVAAAWASRWWNIRSIAARNALAATLADDKPLALDGYDAPEPLWTDVLLENALHPCLLDGPAETPEERGGAGSSLEAAVVRA